MTEVTPKTEPRAATEPTPNRPAEGSTNTEQAAGPKDAGKPRSHLPLLVVIALFAIAGGVAAGWALSEKRRADDAASRAMAKLEAAETRLTRSAATTYASLEQSGLAFERTLRLPRVQDGRRKLVENALEIFLDVAGSEPSPHTPPGRAQACYRRAAFAAALLGRFDDAKAHLAKATTHAPAAANGVDDAVSDLLASAIAEAEDNAPTRDEALTRAITALDARATSDDATATNVRDAALAWIRLGTLRERSARLRAATEAYDKALTRTRAIDPDLAATTEVRAAAALANLQLGKLAVRERRADDAGRYLDQTTLLLRGLIGGDVADPTYATWLVAAHIARSETAIIQNRAELAATAARDAVESAERLLRSLRDVDATLSHGRALLSLGRAHRAGGDRARARATLKRAESILANLCRLDPDSFDANMALSRAQLLIAEGMVSADDAAAATTRYRDALRRLDRIAVASLDSSAHRELRGKLALAMGRYQGAKEPIAAAEGALAEAIETFESLLEGWPAVNEYRRLLAESHFVRASAWLAGDRPQRAASSQRDGIRTIQPLVDARPADWRLRAELARAHAIHAMQHQRARQLSKARESARLAMANYRECVTLAPDDEALRRQQIESITLNARIMLALGDHGSVSREMDELLRTQPDQQLTVASYLSAAIPVALADTRLSRANRDHLATKYGDVAIRVLRNVFEAGDLSMEKLDEMKELLAPIKDRQSYRRLVADVVLMTTEAAKKKR